MCFLKVLQKFIDSGQETANEIDLYSLLHCISFGEIGEDFVERRNSYNCVIISERVTKSFLVLVPDQLFHYRPQDSPWC